MITGIKGEDSKIKFISELSKELLNKEIDQNFFKFFTNKFSELFPKTIVASFSYDSNTHSSFLEHCNTKDHELDQSIRLFKKAVSGIKISLRPDILDTFSNYEIISGQMSILSLLENKYLSFFDKIIKHIRKELNSYNLLLLQSKSEILGAILFLRVSKDEFEYNDLVKTIINLASNSIQKFKIHEALRLDEERNKFALENSNNGIWDLDINTKRLYISPRWKSMLGYSLKDGLENKQEQFHKLLHPDDYELVVSETRKYLDEENDKYEIEFRLRHKLGHYVPILSIGKKFISKYRNYNRLVGIHIDLTEEKNSEKEISHLKERSKILFEKSTDAVLILRNRKFIHCNSSAAKLFAFGSLNNLNKVRPHEISPEFQPDGISSLEKADMMMDMAVKNGHHRFEWIHRDMHGNDIWVEVLLTYLPSKNDEVIYTVIRDIRAQKANSIRLRESQKKYRLLAENSNDIIVLLSEKLKIDYISPSIYRLTGWTQSEVSVMKFSKLITGESFIELMNNLKEFETSSDYEQKVRQEIQFKRKDGSRFWTEMIASAIKSDNKISGYIAQIRDIDKRKELAKQLLSAKEKAEQSDMLKSRFLANMSHEIRTPMNSILGFTELIKDDISPEDKEKYLGIIQTNGKQLLNIINDIIDISKIEANQLKISKSEFDIKAEFYKLKEMFLNEAERKGLKIIFNFVSDDLNTYIFSDQLRITQIFTNLINNAIKFTNIGKIDIDCELNNNLLIFNISDTGIGISSKDHKHIFERFIRATKNPDYAGTGLGLAIVNSLTKLLNGKIELKSELDIGTSFKIEIPVKRKANNLISDTLIKNPDFLKDLSQKSIIIGEEDDDIFESLEKIVNVYFKNVIRAKTGKESVRKLNHQDTISLVIINTQITDMNGFRAVSLINTLNPSIPVIAYIINDDQDILKQAQKSGFSNIILESFNKDEILKTISGTIEKAIV